MGEIQQAANRVSADERLRARQRAIGVILKTFFWALLLVLVVLAGIAAVGWVRWPFALWTGGVMLGLYVVVSLALFLFAQRDLFAEMNLRQSQLGELETMQANLRTALQDVSRLSTAYGQLLSWCRVLGAVLRAPFGPAPAARPSPGQLFDGLPRSTQLGVADPGDAAGRRRRARDSAAPVRIGLADPAVAGHDQRGGRAAARGTRDAVPDAGHRHAVRAGSVVVLRSRRAGCSPPAPTRCGARVEQMFAEEHGESPTRSPARCWYPAWTGMCLPGNSARASPSTGDGRAAPFDASLFTHAATTAGRSSGGGRRDGGRARRAGVPRGGGAGQ